MLGGPASATVLYVTEKFRRDNLKTYKAFVDALAEAAQFIKANPDKAADGVSLEYRAPQRVVRATHRIALDVFEGTASCCWAHLAAASRPC